MEEWLYSMCAEERRRRRRAGDPRICPRGPGGPGPDDDRGPGR